MIVCQRVRIAFLMLLVGVLVSPSVLATTSADRTAPAPRVTAPSCDDFARRQTQLADRLLEQSNYTRAIKVLQSTIKNCDRDIVREKLFDVLEEWYGVVRSGSESDFKQYVNVLSNQSALTSTQKSKLTRRVRSYVRSKVKQNHNKGEYNEAYRWCREYSQHVDEHFASEYYCGRSAKQLGRTRTAMNAYAWLLDNWSSTELASWGEIAGQLESMYLLGGRFEKAYGLARQMAVRNPTPQSIIASLISARGNFLAPLLRVSAAFYKQSPAEAAMSHVDDEMRRVSFPEYVRSFYIVGEEGKVKRGMYGSGATQPSASLLSRASGRVSLLQSEEDDNLAWLVSPLGGSRYLVLEFGVATTAEENVRLESVSENVRSDQQWQKLYDLEFKKTYPASGSAIGTILSASQLADLNFGGHNVAFDDSPVLTYYCIQNASEEIEASYNFDRSYLEYGESEWDRTSNTPALYHHSTTYGGEPIREVVWPKFVDDKWTGVVRVGLAQS